jgi:hypothetical protein
MSIDFNDFLDQNYSYDRTSMISCKQCLTRVPFGIEFLKGMSIIALFEHALSHYLEPFANRKLGDLEANCKETGRKAHVLEFYYEKEEETVRLICFTVLFTTESGEEKFAVVNMEGKRGALGHSYLAKSSTSMSETSWVAEEDGKFKAVNNNQVIYRTKTDKISLMDSARATLNYYSGYDTSARHMKEMMEELYSLNFNVCNLIQDEIVDGEHRYFILAVEEANNDYLAILTADGTIIGGNDSVEVPYEIASLLRDDLNTLTHGIIERY